jgi:hypothetical protein
MSSLVTGIREIIMKDLTALLVGEDDWQPNAS